DTIVLRDLQPNDLVWLIRIGESSVAAQLFEIPFVGITRAERIRQLETMTNARNNVRAAIAALKQHGTRTDLRDPIETAIQLLQAKERAVSRILVVASDFVQDGSTGRPSTAPPPTSTAASARGIRVAMLHARPTDRYLSSMRLSASEL